MIFRSILMITAMEGITFTPGFTYVLGLNDIFDNDYFAGLNVGFGF